MPRPRTIPPRLEPDILAKAGEGLSLHAIAAWLATEHQVRTSPVSVHRLLTRIRDERAPIAQAVVREKLAGILTKDLDTAAGVEARAIAVEAAAQAGIFGDKDNGIEPLPVGSEEWKRCTDSASRARNDAMRVVEHRARLSGAAGSAANEDAGAVRARLLEKMQAAEEG